MDRVLVTLLLDNQVKLIDLKKIVNLKKIIPCAIIPT